MPVNATQILSGGPSRFRQVVWLLLATLCGIGTWWLADEMLGPRPIWRLPLGRGQPVPYPSAETPDGKLLVGYEMDTASHPDWVKALLTLDAATGRTLRRQEVTGKTFLFDQAQRAGLEVERPWSL